MREDVGWSECVFDSKMLVWKLWLGGGGVGLG
jgi:hypothetical protein